MNEESLRMLKECSLPSWTWWVIQFEDGTYYGEEQDDGWTLNLYKSERAALRDVSRLMDEGDVFYRAVEITLPGPNPRD